MSLEIKVKCPCPCEDSGEMVICYTDFYKACQSYQIWELIEKEKKERENYSDFN